jgi:hypothetical protein
VDCGGKGGKVRDRLAPSIAFPDKGPCSDQKFWCFGAFKKYLDCGDFVDIACLRMEPIGDIRNPDQLPISAQKLRSNPQ